MFYGLGGWTTIFTGMALDIFSGRSKLLLWRGELYPLKAVWQIKGVGDVEEALLERRAEGLGDGFMIVVLAFLAGPEKAPAKMNRELLVSFEDDAEYVLFVEKKLQGECLVIDLIGFFVWEFCYFHGIRNDDPGLTVSFEGNFFCGGQAGGGYNE